MTSCEQCGETTSIDGGICTEETGRLCQTCADTTNWEQYVDSKYIDAEDTDSTSIYE